MRACPLSSCPESYLYNNPNSCDGPLELDDHEGGYSTEELCILQRLADGSPGRIELQETCEGYTSRRSVYVLGSTVAILTGSESQPCADCACGSQTEWGGLDLCTLQETESFLNCLQASERKHQLGCMVPETWFLDCSPSGPQCTP